MKSGKPDKTIKNLLEKRRIEPSASAWKKLSTELDKSERRSQKPYLWTGIAAVFLIGFFVGGFVFKQGKTNPETIKIVGNSEEKEPLENNTEIENASPHEKGIREEIIPVGTKNSKNPVLVKPMKKLDGLVEQTPSSPQNENPIEEESLAMAPLEDSIFLEKEAEKILQKIMLKTQPDNPKVFAGISDAEIEGLLREAQAEIDKKPYFVWEDNHVDAGALLESVERELNPSYKERLFRFVEDKLIQLASASGIANP